MKTLKHFLLCAIVLLGYTATKAQCSVLLLSYNQGSGNYYFWAQTDSTPAGQLPVDWDFGDGSTLSAANGSQYHTYSASGTYIVSATVTGGGCTNTDYDTIVVDICDYLANSYIYAFINGNYAQYQLVTAGAISAYSWSLPGATSSTTNNNSSPIVTYPGAGDYGVCLTYTGANGCTSTLCDTFTLNGIGQSCDAWFSYNNSNLGVNVWGGVQDSLSPWVILTYDFGDGNVVTAPWGSSSHNYSAYGTYDICLSSLDTVTGCTDTVCQQVTLTPPTIGDINGIVYKGPSNGACAIVYLIVEDSTGYLSLADSMVIADSSGNCFGYYGFSNLPTGRPYFVKAALQATDADYANYLPTYYGDVLNWSNATPIDLLNPSGPYDIHMIAGVNTGGPGFVGGWVSQGAGLVAGPGVFEGRGVGDPIEGVQINLTDVNDNPVAYAYTDVDGHYQFSNLALGTYKIYAERLSITPVPSNVTLTANNPSVNNVNVVINSTTAVTGVDDLKSIYVEGIFPNPVVDNSTITISLKEAAELTVRVIDITGRVLVNTTVDVNPGTHQLPVSLKGMAAGAYNVSLTNGTDNKVIRLMKAQ